MRLTAARLKMYKQMMNDPITQHILKDILSDPVPSIEEVIEGLQAIRDDLE